MKRELSEQRLGERTVRALAAALERAGAPEWDLYYEEGRELSIEVQDGEVDAYEAARSAGASVRVIDNGRIGFAYTTALDEAALGAAAQAARAAASASDPDPLVSLPGPDDVRALPSVELTDRALSELPIADKIERTRAIEAAARAASPRVARVRKASYGEGWSRARLLNSRGVDLEDEGTLLHCDVMVVAAEGDEEQLGWEAQMGHFLRELDFEACGRTAAERATALLGARPVPTARYPVVLEPHVVCEILDVLADSLLAESVWKQRSLLKGRDGQEVASALVTLVDDGTHPGGAAASRFDGEGMPRQRTVVVGEGILRSFLYDRYWAAKMGRASTGNSDRAGFRAAPVLGTSNLILAAGTAGDPAQLAREMGQGLVVSELIGVHTADPISGDFSLGASGQLVRAGERGQPVSGIAVAGNLLGLLRAVRGVGSDLRFYGSAGAPSVLLEALDVAGG